MQIILVQAEVEQALRDFVSRRLTLAENTQIKIDMQATRGAEGIKATIDLIEGGQEEVTTTKTITKVKETPAAAPAKAEAVKPQETASAAADAVETTAVPVEDLFQQEEAAAIAAEAPAQVANGVAVEGGAGSPAKSLFAGITKPKNP